MGSAPELYREIHGKKWRYGYTTGTCAAAAAKAATAMLFGGQVLSSVTVTTPRGQAVTLPLCDQGREAGEAKCAVVKDAGDDPDITHGMKIHARAVKIAVPEIIIRGGEGIGVVTKPGLQVPVGEPAINPVPRAMIRQAVAEVLPAGAGVEVTISVPGGEEIAGKTLNPVLGIAGGISIIGTTGIVEPMSEEGFKHSLTPQIQVALASGHHTLVFTPGKIGENLATTRYGIPAGAVILTSNFLGFMLDEAARLGVHNILLFGHIGKIVKVAAGVFHTHSRVADARMETMAAHAAALGAGRDVVQALLGCTTTEAAVQIIAALGLEELYAVLAAKASRRASQYVAGKMNIGTVLVAMDGTILGMDDMAKKLGEQEGWNL